MTETGEYHKCGKPDCLRKVSLASRYCCYSCSTAADAPAPYEIEPHAPGLHWALCHSAECEARKAQRGAYSVFEAGLLLARGDTMTEPRAMDGYIDAALAALGSY